MSDDVTRSTLSRRELLGTMGKAAAVVALQPILQTAIAREARASTRPLGTGAPVNGVAGVDRVVVLPGKTYLRGWAGYGEPPRRTPPRRGAPVDTTPVPTGPTPNLRAS